MSLRIVNLQYSTGTVFHHECGQPMIYQQQYVIVSQEVITLLCGHSESTASTSSLQRVGNYKVQFLHSNSRIRTTCRRFTLTWSTLCCSNTQSSSDREWHSVCSIIEVQREGKSSEADPCRLYTAQIMETDLACVVLKMCSERNDIWSWC